MDPFLPVPVPNYSQKEFESCYRYYQERRWLQHPQSRPSVLPSRPRSPHAAPAPPLTAVVSPGRTEEGRKELVFMSNRNPSALERLCAFL